MLRHQTDTTSTPARVLLVSPDRVFTEAMQSVLSAKAYRISGACQPKEAASIIAEQDLDLIVAAPLVLHCAANSPADTASSTLQPTSTQAIIIGEAAGAQAIIDRCLKFDRQTTGFRSFNAEFIEQHIAHLRHSLPKRAIKLPRPLHTCHWIISMQFDIETLRQTNPIQSIVDIIIDCHGFQGQREIIFTIVSELFSNALDHGLLQMDSRQKQTPEGFLRFYEQRQERLNNATSGKIDIAVAYRPKTHSGQLRFDIQDSGKGFKIDDVFTSLKENQGYFGRGIKLTRQLCQSVDYNASGNRVEAIYDWHYQQSDRI